MRRLPECDKTLDNMTVIIKLLNKIYSDGLSNITYMFDKSKQLNTAITEIQMNWILKNFKGSEQVLKYIIVLKTEVINEYTRALPGIISRAKISETKKKYYIENLNKMIKEYA